MSGPDERTDAWLRQALGDRPRPGLDPRLAERVLRRVAEREAAPGPRTGSRWRLAACWLAVALGSLFVFLRLPAPDGAATLVRVLALVLVPSGYALALWPAAARAWLGLPLRLLLPRED